MQEACKQIQQVSSWEEYFKRIGVATPSKEALIEWYAAAAFPAQCRHIKLF